MNGSKPEQPTGDSRAAVKLSIGVAGLLLVASGAAWIYPPAGSVVLGVGMVASVLDFEPSRRADRDTTNRNEREGGG